MMKDLFDIVVALMLIVPFEMIIFLFKRIQTDFPFMKIKRYCYYSWSKINHLSSKMKDIKGINKESVELQYMIFRKPDTIRNEKKS